MYTKAACAFLGQTASAMYTPSEPSATSTIVNDAAPAAAARMNSRRLTVVTWTPLEATRCAS